jgi:hypothetical protein
MNEKGGSCFPSFRRMAKETGLDRKTVERHILKAEDDGWIDVDRSKGQSNHYSVRLPEQFWTGLEAGIEDEEKIALELTQSAPVAFSTPSRDKMADEGGDRESPPPDKGGGTESPPPDEGGGRGSPPVGAEDPHPSNQVGAQDPQVGAQDPQGGGTGSPEDVNEDDKEDVIQEDEEESARRKKTSSSTRAEQNGDPFDFLNDRQRSYLPGIRRAWSRIERGDDVGLVVKELWNEQGAPVSRFRDELNDLHRRAPLPEFVAAAVLTAKRADTPNVGYMRTTLQSFHRRPATSAESTGRARPTYRPPERNSEPHAEKPAGDFSTDWREEMEAAASEWRRRFAGDVGPTDDGTAGDPSIDDPEPVSESES